MTKQQREHIIQLLRKVAERPSTETLIAFVAQNFGMIEACRKISTLFSGPETAESEWLLEQALKFNIKAGALRIESESILAIFRPGFEGNEEYKVLGLSPLATIAEVKTAFRQLSFRYHPDSSAAHEPGDAEKFIAICRAHKKIMQAHEADTPSSAAAESIPWRHQDLRQKKKPNSRRKLIFPAVAIIVGLLFVTFSFTRSYRKKAMLKSLGEVPVISKEAMAEKPQKPVPAPVAAAVSVPQPKKTASQPSPPVPRLETPVKVEPKLPPVKTSPVKIVSAKSLPVKSAPVTPKPVSMPVQEAMAEKPQKPLPAPVAAATVAAQPEIRVAKAEIKKAASEPPLLPIHRVAVPAKAAPKLPAVKAAPVKIVSAKSSPVKAAPKLTPQLPPLRRRVKTFLKSYTEAYEGLDFNVFATFFTFDAIENDTLFKLRAAKYHKLFARLQEVLYSIKSDFMRVDNQFIYVTGHFRASLLFRDGKELNVHGPTSLLLREDAAHHFKVKNLTYSLD